MAKWFCERCRSILSVDYRRSPEALAAYRIAFAASCLLLVGVPQFSWISDNPAAFFHPPPGLAQLMPGFPPAWLLQALDLTIVLLFGVLLLGRHVRTASLALFALILYGNLFRFSFGKIDHDILFVLTPLLFAWSWGGSVSSDAPGRERHDQGERGLALGLLACLIAFGFTTSAIPKMVHWLDFDLTTHAVKGWVFKAAISDRGGHLVPFFTRLEAPLFWEIADIVAVLFEIGFVVALFVGPRLFKVWIGMAVLFHFFNYLMLNISFVVYIPVYLAFVDWETAARRLRSADLRLPASPSNHHVIVGAIAIAFFVLWGLATRSNWPVLTLLDGLPIAPFNRKRTLFVLAASSAITLALGVRWVVGFAQRSRRPSNS
jgi:hypothetical protein